MFRIFVETSLGYDPKEGELVNEILSTDRIFANLKEAAQVCRSLNGMSENRFARHFFIKDESGNSYFPLTHAERNGRY